MEKPIIFLAFANDRDNYLSMITRERKNIRRALRRHHDEGLIQVEAEASSSLEDVFDMFTNYDNQIAIFHYGGHAGGTHLQLESEDGAQEAYAGGMAKILGAQESLRLVFMNGCATKPQVDLLLKSGVKAVIATSVPIQDHMAVEFAEQFYNSLTSHTTIQRAFQVAEAFTAAKYKNAQNIKIYRDVVMHDFMQTGDPNALPWGLYYSDEEALQWTLPKRVSKKQVLKNRFDYETRVDVNEVLIDVICEALAEHNKDLDYELNKEELDIPAIKREIVDSFPTPIGEQLRKLFTRSNDPDRPDDMELFSRSRLEQIVTTHRTTVKFLCYILLSQLWDEKNRNSDLEITEDYIVDFNSFFAVGEGNYQSFDYVKLINTITAIFDKFNIPYFINELKDIQINPDKQDELYEAYVFMNSLHEGILDDTIESDEVETLCTEAEGHLGIVLRAIAFLVKYKLVTIKNIEIVKHRHEPARFRHSQITLNRALTVASTGVAEVGVEFNNFTDNKAVLFIKSDKSDVSGYLNLTPFIIDENALNNDYSTKLFLFAYPQKGAYKYQFLNNLKDEPLIVNEENYKDIKMQFDRFRSEIFGQTYQEAAKEAPVKKRLGGSRFSRKR